MKTMALCSLRLLAALFLWAGLTGRLQAATYLPLSDADLARRSPLIVRARVIAQEARLESVDGQDIACTLTTFRMVEVLKGSIERDTFRIELPGGRAGNTASWIPGTPIFKLDSEVILFLSPTSWRESDVSLTEFGLSKFDIVEDRIHRRFAVRPVFTPQQDDYLSRREPVLAPARIASSSPRPLRDADSFVAALKAFRSAGELPQIEYIQPEGDLRIPGGGVRPLWVNIGGVEGSGNLFRWFWDTGASPNAIVTTVGAQSSLSDGSDGLPHVQNGITQWVTGVSGATVNYSSSSGTGAVVVNLDVESHPPNWTSSLSCGTGGTIGLAGPQATSTPRTFKGDTYFAVRSGSVFMRKITGTGQCYNFATFRTAVMHEIGHTLGLGHPDEAQSVHSTTTMADWQNAVMTSTIPPSRPFIPQTDDIQAIQYYYGEAILLAPTANFTFSPAAPTPGQTVNFTDTSTGPPASWSWNFGDPTSGANNTSTAQNPSHVFSAPGIYTVGFTGTNALGSSSTSKTLIVATASGPCVAGANTLCLNATRFRVQVTWRVPSQGTSGAGNASTLTTDTGYFWFFSSNNIELVVKVVDGRAFNGKFWVFYGALSDVEYTITVTDMLTGAVKVYSNASGNLASKADIEAF